MNQAGITAIIKEKIATPTKRETVLKIYFNKTVSIRCCHTPALSSKLIITRDKIGAKIKTVRSKTPTFKAFSILRVLNTFTNLPTHFINYLLSLSRQLGNFFDGNYVLSKRTPTGKLIGWTSSRINWKLISP